MAHSSTHNLPPPKPCVACGRPITWRKKWERDWPGVKFCGEACRRRRIDQPRASDSRQSDTREADPLEAAILFLLSKRAAGATICPSEVARMVAPGEWRSQMEPIRAAARRLAQASKIAITQNGRAVGTSPAKGPIRLKAIT